MWSRCVWLAEVNSAPGDARAKIALKIILFFHGTTKKEGEKNSAQVKKQLEKQSTLLFGLAGKDLN